MAAGILIFPGAQPSRSRQGTVISAELRWYVNETTTPATVYTDPALTVPHQFPIVSDDAGRFPLIYADDTEVFSCNWSTAAPDSQVQSYDFISPTTAADTVLLDEMNAALSDAMDLYESLDAVDAAVVQAQEYAAEAADAATGAPGTNATSSTSLTIGTGTKSLTVEANKLFVVGMTVTIAYTVDGSNAMSGQVASYNPTTGALVVTVVSFTGSGTYAAWTVSLSALPQTIKLLKSSRTANTKLVLGDARQYIDITSGSFTQTLDPSSVLGDGWYVDYGNSGTGTITVDPDSAETIGGLSTWQVLPGELYRFRANGSNGFDVIAIKTDLGPHMIVRDEKAANTAAGNGSATSWVTRTLNTSVRNVIQGASLASDKITLPAGKYRIRVEAPAFGVNTTRARLYNVTDSSVASTGPSGYAPNNGGATPQSATVIVDDVITITAQKDFRVEQYTQAANSSSDLGRPVNDGSSEVYTTVWVTKII